MDICYGCGKELDWNEHIIKWQRVYFGTIEKTKPFCSAECIKKDRKNVKGVLTSNLEQMSLF